MNKKTKLIPLNFDQSLQYVKEQLCDGHTLAQELLKNLNFYKGHFFTLIHSPADRTKIHQFRKGGIQATNPLRTVLFNEQPYLGRKKGNSVQELAEYLKNIMNSDQCCYFEDLLHRRQDPIAIKFKSNILYYHEEPYLFLQHSHFSIERAMEIIHYVDAQWYYMNIVTKEEPGSTSDIPDEKFQSIVLGTDYVVIGAYDMEGFVVWERLI